MPNEGCSAEHNSGTAIVDGPFYRRSGGGSVGENPGFRYFIHTMIPFLVLPAKLRVWINRYHRPVAAGGVGAELELGREPSRCIPRQRVLETRRKTQALGTSVQPGQRRNSLTWS